MAEIMVSAGEAARRLGVAPATIQRWVDSGLLNAERTPGGHRRIYVTEVRRLMATNRSTIIAGPLADWLEVLMTGDPHRVRDALLASRRRAECWADVADEVASAIGEIGRRWEAGCCEIFEEHAASEALRRAAAACADQMPRGADARHAVLLTVENERHTLGLSLAELVVAEAGWRTTWIGEGPPLAELDSLLNKLKPQLLVVSASSGSRPAPVAAYQAALERAAASSHTPIALAGSGAWAGSRQAARLLAFGELRALLAA